MREFHALRRELIKIRRNVGFTPIGREAFDPEIIGKYHDDIGLRRLSSGNCEP